MKRTVISLLLVAALCFTAAAVLAQEAEVTPVPVAATPEPAPMHPTFALLDTTGANVSVSDAAISTLQTCGTCHDVAYITSHTLHGDGGRVVSGVLPPAELVSTDVEMDCFLCHMPDPNNDARLSALASGQANWANTATLAGNGIVTLTDGVYRYNADAFDAAGLLKPEFVTIQDPRSDNCGACHGQVHLDNQTPLVPAAADASQWRTFTTGQVVSPQRISNGGGNISGRSDLTRPWDVHAERVLNCVDCHYSVNNPIYVQTNSSTAPEHLVFDPRRADLGEYIERPSHEFAAGTDTMRSCSTCHDAESSHAWLPYWSQHTEALACETCHVPTLYAPALAVRDATVMRADGSPVDQYRGVEGGLGPVAANTVSTLVTGYQPVLLQQIDADGSQQLSPYNLVTVYYWVVGDDAQAVTDEALRTAYFDGAAYAADVLTAFDADGDGTLSDTELTLDKDSKLNLIAERLTAQGLTDPRIVGEVVPYAIHHDVIGGEWATRDCQTCHSEDSRIVAALPLSNRAPGGVQPTFVSDETVNWNGSISQTSDGILLFQPATQTPAATLYIFGRDSVQLIDLLGVLIVLGASVGVLVHAGLRVIVGRRQATHAEPALKHVYMYSMYERQWHWLQTFVIFGLTFTGLVVHKPDMFSLFNFAWMVDVHNLFALLLVINAALAFFYHLVSGEIKQFIPRPYGFFDHMMEQAVFYLRGIFRGDPHPFEKRRDQKMNPIQQLTYFGLLNVLLPLQILTGVLMWGIQQFPQIATALGGLPVLAPFHTLIAWLLVTFVIVHVYMTTTGHTPLANIQAMIMGYDDVETHPQHSES
ncbi:MAG: cytochrome b/b6 domain-containing protein [Chloroflexi bacterium]|nr:cytochrome b/b6 domain-containing protein [Chloroflexota bacterium]